MHENARARLGSSGALADGGCLNPGDGLSNSAELSDSKQRARWMDCSFDILRLGKGSALALERSPSEGADERLASARAVCCV